MENILANENKSLTNKAVFALRVVFGLIAGLFITYLINKIETGHGLEQNVDKITIVSLTSIVTAILWAGLGTMRSKTLVIWVLISGALGAYILHYLLFEIAKSNDTPPLQLFLMGLMIFILHELVSSADQARKFIAPYNLYFEEAWKRVTQLILAWFFLGAFWIIMFVGAALFKAIGIKFLDELCHEKWFNIPISFVALAIAVQLGDVKANILNSFRALVLNVFSWLLPVIVVIGALFVAALPFTGLKPLWDTKAASTILIIAAAILVLLINSAYQNGEVTINPVLKIAIRIGSFLILVFGLIAAYSLYLRIEQYGLSPARIIALIGTIWAILFGFAYVAANFLKSPIFIGRIREFNVFLAIFEAAVLLCILTPIADPSRLSVNSQVARLIANKITPEEFDFKFLARKSGTYGKAALALLKSNNNPKIREFAAAAEAKSTASSNFDTDELKEFKPRRESFHVLNNQPLPEGFLNTIFHSYDIGVTPCMRQKQVTTPCDTYLIDMNGDNKAEIVVAGEQTFSIFYEDKNENKGEWKAKIAYAQNPDIVMQSFKSGQVAIVKPEWSDLKIGNEVVKISN